MKKVRLFNRKDNVIVVEITHPHWQSGKPTKQQFFFRNDDSGREESVLRLKALISRGYKYFK
jgi:hypothetical protein